MPMKKSRTQDTAADFARRSNATSRMNRPAAGNAPRNRRGRLFTAPDAPPSEGE
jgi:hypothetical protein